MSKISQSEKTEIFLNLHRQKDKLLILPNIWDPIGARILEAKGFPAAATASAAISSSLGFKDGERIKFKTHIEIIRRITGSVNIPVTADIESGYSENAAQLKETIEKVLEAGVAGINLEDSLPGEDSLRDTGEQCDRIAAAREAANVHGIHLVINARTDPFLVKGNSSEEEKIKEVIKRAAEYIRAGADCIFPPGAREKSTIVNLRKEIKSPLNIIAGPGGLPLKTLQEIGINRVSFGPNIFRSVLKKFEKIADELYNLQGYECFTSETLSFMEAQRYLSDARES